MKSFKNFLFEAKTPEELAKIAKAKTDSYVGKYMKYFKDHPKVQKNPEEAKKLIAASMPLQTSHSEAVYTSRNFLDGILKPDEDNATINFGLSRFRSALKRKVPGVSNESLESHTHDSLMKHLTTFDDEYKKTDNTVYPSMDDLKKYKIGKISHPIHGDLNVLHIQSNDIQNNAEYKTLSKRLKQNACGENNYCIFDEKHGPEHLKDYSEGHGFFAYTNKNNRIVISHGFGDRGIVDHQNTVLSDNEAEIVKKQTSKLLSGSKKDVYDFFGGINKNLSLEQQRRIYDEFEGTAPHFTDPKVNTHPEILSYFLDDRSFNHYTHKKVLEHPNVTPKLLSQALNSKKLETNLSAIKHPKVNPEFISKALDHYDSEVRFHAIKHPNASSENITKALNDKNYSIRGAALEHPNVSSDNITQALKSEYDDIRRLAIYHPKVSEEHFTMAAASDDPSLRKAAKKHQEHIKKLQDIESLNKTIMRIIK